MRVWAMCVLVACGGGSKKDGGAVDGPPLSGDGPTQAGCPIFPANHVFNTRIDSLPVDAHSADYIATIGDTIRVHLDLGTQTDQQAADYYGIPSNTVKGNSFAWPDVAYGSGNYLTESDCSNANRDVLSPCPGTPAKLPIPSQVLVEGGIQTNQAVYGDHHILLFDSDNCRLWETYHSYMAGAGFEILGSAEWDLRSNALRPDGWTSADAAGFPIFPLLLRASEADSGAITHAVRFTMPTTRTSHVWPARHDAGSASNITVPPMGQLFRLKASYSPPTMLHPQSLAIVNALKQYGMYLADNGSAIYIQGEPSATWQDTTFTELQMLQAQDFEAVDIAPITQRAGFDPNSATVPP